jgi:hypothetical protein
MRHYICAMLVGICISSATPALDLSPAEQAVWQIITGMCAAQEPIKTPRG